MVDVESRENENRRDDVLESDFIRHSDRNNQEYDLRRRMAETSFQQANELFNTRQKARDAQAAINAREDEAYSGLTFRDASAHSTAVAALEASNSEVGAAEGEEIIEHEEEDES